MPPSAEQIAGFADYLYQSARIRFGEERAEALRPMIPQGAVPSGAWAGRCPSLAGYVTVTGATDGATAAGGRSC